MMPPVDTMPVDERITVPETEFKLKFDGRLNELKASTLGYALVNISTIVSEATREVDTVATVDINVKATAPGSFEVYLALHSTLDGIFQLLGPQGVAQASSAALVIVKMIGEVFKLRKLLKGEPPKEAIPQGDSYEIHARDNTRMLVDRRTYNLHFNHPDVNDALSNIFRTLQSDQSVERFEISDKKDNVLFDAVRDDFPQMASGSTVLQPETRERIEQEWVHVVRASFARNLNWEVLYRGHRITVKVKDKRFLDNVEAGEKFAKGDTLFVTLRIEQRWDKQLGAYVNRKFEVLEVNQHIPRDRIIQGKLELPPSPRAEEK